MKRSSGVRLEGLEPRLQFAGGLTDGDSSHTDATTTSSAAPVRTLVVLNTRGTLYVGGTNDQDSIRLRPVGDKLQITLTSLNDITFSPFLLSARSGESAIAPDSVVASTRDGANLVTRVYNIASSRIARILLDGRGGHDVANVKAVPVDVTPDDTERFDVTPLPAPEGQKPWQAVARTDTRWIEAERLQLRLANASRATSAFVGDSHSELFPHRGAETWKRQFPNSLNLGIAGDSTQQLLWRIEHGLFDKFKPSLLVVTIGTNNLNTTAHSGTADEIARGIRQVVAELRAKLPETRIVLLGIIPRRRAWQNEQIVKINAMSTSLTQNRRVHLINLYTNLVGQPVRETLYVPLEEHLNASGYALFADRLVRILRTPV